MIKKEESNKYSDLFNLAYIPLDTIEDERKYIYDESKQENIISPEDNENVFRRGIIYGTQVVLKKLYDDEYVEEDKNKPRQGLNKLIDIDELDDDLSVALIHGVTFDNQMYEKKKKNEPVNFPVYLVREWVKGTSLANFYKKYSKITQDDIIKIVYHLAKIIEHYHKYRCAYVTLRPKKVIVTTDFKVILNDIVKLVSIFFNKKISNQIKNEEKDSMKKFNDKQNRFLHPYLYLCANYPDKFSLKAGNFDHYQFFDCYSLGCIFYYLYFSKDLEQFWGGKPLSEIYNMYYEKNSSPSSDEFRFKEEDIPKSITDYNKLFSLFGKDLEDDNRNKEIKKIIRNLLFPYYSNQKEPYKMKNALADLSNLPEIKKYKESKEFDYDLKEEYEKAMEEFQKIFDEVSKLNEENGFDEKLKDKLFEF